MQISYTTKEELELALASVNARFSRNITLNAEPLNLKGTRFKVRLNVVSSKAPGSRRGPSGRRIHAACWHVHGHFFDALLDNNPSTIIRAGALKIYQDKGVNGQGGRWNNWQDRNIGSMISPLYFSEACNCNE